MLAVVALSLTALGVVVAAVDNNPSGVSDAALALHGKAPHTAKIALTIDTSQQYQVTGTLDVNFDHNSFAGTLAIPTIFSTTHVSVVLFRHHLYAGIPALASIEKAPWISFPSSLDLFGYGYALAKLKLDLPFLRALGPYTTTHQGPFTTYHFHGLKLPLPGINTKSTTFPRSARVSLDVTMASEGQVSSVVATVVAGAIHFKVTAQILSYNQPVKISAPPANMVQKSPSGLFGSRSGSQTNPITQLLTPAGIVALGQIHVS